ncbi:transporter substrate-binding domain-containing protein [Pseudomonas sp.]|uniref:transporter substrate-binding domain-containing protein n=1 Tax=Pseudomonas sp. TaxID=306 RepID=UPI0035642C8C
MVSEAWPPYIHDDNGVLRGLDYQAARTVLQRLGVEVEWQLLPWRRCLLALEQARRFANELARAGLCSPADTLQRPRSRAAPQVSRQTIKQVNAAQGHRSVILRPSRQACARMLVPRDQQYRTGLRPPSAIQVRQYTP